MGRIVRLGAVLALITIISAFALAELYNKTKPQIEIIKQKKTHEALEKVLPKAGDIVAISHEEPIKDPSGKVVDQRKIIDYYVGYADQNHNKIVGYAVKAAKSGYSSVVETMVGLNQSGMIEKITVLNQRETPGLGAKCIDSKPFDPKHPKWTTEQFIGKTTKQLKVEKDGGEIVSITGATITSRAITNSIREKLEEFLPKIEVRDSTNGTPNENAGE